MMVDLTMHTPLGRKTNVVYFGEPTTLERPGPPGRKPQMLRATAVWNEDSAILVTEGAVQETGEVVLRFERELIDGGKRMRFTERFLEGGRSGNETGDWMERTFARVE